jgi:hypothetical protein
MTSSFLCLALAALAASSCSAAQQPGDPAPPSSGTWVLEVGKPIDLPSGGGTVVLEKVDDSRCPVGVTCVWEGEATAFLAFRGGGAPDERVDLSLRAKSTGEARGLQLELTAVEPHPKVNEPVDPASYRATVEWRRP